MNKKLIRAIAVSAVLLLPLLTSAATIYSIPSGSFTSVSSIVTAILNFVWPIAAGIAVILFIYGGILLMTSTGDPTKVASARNVILYAVIGLVVALLAFSFPAIWASIFPTT